MCIRNEKSPCEGCTRVSDPTMCDNKNCKLWKAWFQRRWSLIHGYGKKYLREGAHEMEK